MLEQGSQATADVNIGGFIGVSYIDAMVSSSFSTGNINARLTAEEIYSNGTEPASYEKLGIYGFSMERASISNVYVIEDQILIIDRAVYSVIVEGEAISVNNLKSIDWQMEHLFDHDSRDWILNEGQYPSFDWSHK